MPPIHPGIQAEIVVHSASPKRASMATIHHSGLKREADVPAKTVAIWQQSGWEPGPLPVKARKIVNPKVVETHAPESGDPNPPLKEA